MAYEPQYPDTPVSVYRCFGVANSWIYVGSSTNPKVRLRQHKKANWFSLVARVEIDWYWDQGLARDVETQLIVVNQPRANKMLCKRSRDRNEKIETRWDWQGLRNFHAQELAWRQLFRSDFDWRPRGSTTHAVRKWRKEDATTMRLVLNPISDPTWSYLYW